MIQHMRLKGFGNYNRTNGATSVPTIGGPAEGEIGVWYGLTDQVDETDLELFGVILSEEERARRDRLMLANDRRDFSLAHALVRAVLSRYGPTPPEHWQFETHVQGKPAIVASQAGTPALQFNLSHTRGFVACAVARGAPVGIDVELCTREVDALELAPRFFAPEEFEELYAAAPEVRQSRFIELWTVKESYVKAIGTGLSLALNSFAVSFVGSSALRLCAPQSRAIVHVWLVAVSADVRLAVAVVPPTDAQEWRLNFHCINDPKGCTPVILRRSSE